MSPAAIQPRRDRTISAPGHRSIYRRTWDGICWIALGATAAFPADQIGGAAHFIASLFHAVISPQIGNCRIAAKSDRTIDLQATAFAHGLTVPELEATLERRRRETASSAYLSLGLGWLSFLLCLFRLAMLPLTVGRLVSMVEFTPFCVTFFLVAFRSALLNFQTRTRTLASARDYLRTGVGFWPH